MRAAGLLDLVETRIDGVVSAEIGLKGKPEADIFTTAADRLGCSYDRSIVVEDAVSGVAAGKNGRFGLVLGVAREDNITELYDNGADIVVEDLAEVSIESFNDWFAHQAENDSWSITYHGYNPKKERSREALLTVATVILACAARWKKPLPILIITLEPTWPACITAWLLKSPDGMWKTRISSTCLTGCRLALKLMVATGLILTKTKLSPSNAVSILKMPCSNAKW